MAYLKDRYESKLVMLVMHHTYKVADTNLSRTDLACFRNPIISLHSQTKRSNHDANNRIPLAGAPISHT